MAEACPRNGKLSLLILAPLKNSVESNSPPVRDKDLLFGLLQSVSHILHVRLPVHVPARIKKKKNHQRQCGNHTTLKHAKVKYFPNAVVFFL